MTRRITLAIAAVTSDDGTRCADDCPHHEVHLYEDGEPCAVTCDAFAKHEVEWDDDGRSVRLTACMLAEQATREAEASAMRAGFDTAEEHVDLHYIGTGEYAIDMVPARRVLDAELARIRGGKSL